MANTDEMLRLIQHAATLLEVQRDRLITDAVQRPGAVAATAHGAAVLRMVAACMGVENNTLSEARQTAAMAPRDEHGKFTRRQS